MKRVLLILLFVAFFFILQGLGNASEVKAQFCRTTSTNPATGESCNDMCDTANPPCFPDPGTVCQPGFRCVEIDPDVDPGIGECILCETTCSNAGGPCVVPSDCCGTQLTCVGGTCELGGVPICTMSGLSCDPATGLGPDGPCCDGLACIANPLTGDYGCTAPGTSCRNDSGGECRTECEADEGPLPGYDGGPASDCSSGEICCIPVAPPPPPPVGSSNTTPVPYPPGVECDETRDQEFHSLRPYQMSPCNPEATDLALFCGNDFILIDTITITKTFTDGTTLLGLDWSYDFDGNPIDPREESGPDYQLACSYCNQNGDCVTRPAPCIPDAEINCSDDDSVCAPADCVINGDGTETCTFIIDSTADIAIDLSGADLPIMGLTEPSEGSTETYKVVNSVSQDETVADAAKVNEYVSWYLNGVIGRAEYNPPNTNTEAGRSRVINFSGPLKRLLSFENQLIERIQQVQDAEEVRHDQIVACRNVFNQPVACYPGSAPRIRLSWWEDEDRQPPLMSDFINMELYWTAFNNWWNTPINLARLFSYIPFSSTEDRKGEVELSEYSIQPPVASNIVILNSAITNQVPAELFFAHMQESVELADILQKVYSPQEADREADPYNVSAPLAPLCDIAEVRTNPGDDLFATELSATVAYTAQVGCDFTYPGEGRVCNAATGAADGEDHCYSLPRDDWECDTYYGQVDCATNEFCGEGCERPSAICHTEGDICYNGISGERWQCCPGTTCGTVPDFEGSLFCEDDPINVSAFNYTETCTNQVPIMFQTITKTPLADRVWAKLVSGPAGVFRRIFPQIADEEGRPIRWLWDIPAATDVVYSSLTSGTTVAGGEDAQLYFPHIGGVHEYFLNCIQKTLRPQGFGQGCISGPPPLSHLTTDEGVCATPPPPDEAVIGAGLCEIPTSGLCSPSTLMAVTHDYDNVGWSECEANTAAIICNRESGGNPSAINCGCLTGTSVDYSVGLFQINLLAHYIPADPLSSQPRIDCYNAFEYSCMYWWCENQGPISCTVLDQGVVDECADYFFDPENNIIKAYTLSLGGTNWDPWRAGTSCAAELAAVACP